MKADSSARSILVIDSGVGGLSVCQAILAKDPSINIIYYADDAYFPYGLLSEDALLGRLHSIVDCMLDQCQPDLVVFACNTVSTLVLPEMRAKYDIPFVGVVPAIKPAASSTQTKRIGLLATPATVQRPYIDDLIRDFASDCEVVRVGTNDLVVQAENLLSGEMVCKETIAAVIQPFGREGKNAIDTVVLGCTHFPLLKKHLQEALPNIDLIDSGEAIARRVKDLLATHCVLKEEKNNDKSNHQIHFSKTLPDENAFSRSIVSLGFGNVSLFLSPV